MNPMLKIAYDLGCRKAVQDLGLTKTSAHPDDISPEALAALGLIPVSGPLISGVAAGYHAPRGRIMSRVGHNVGGGLLGTVGGSLGGGVGGAGLGAGLGAMLALAGDEDVGEYAGKGGVYGALAGSILGGLGGGAYGRYAGQQRSQGWDGIADV